MYGEESNSCGTEEIIDLLDHKMANLVVTSRDLKGNVDKRMHACGELIKEQFFICSGMNFTDEINFMRTQDISIHGKGESCQSTVKVLKDKLVER